MSTLSLNDSVWVHFTSSKLLVSNKDQNNYFEVEYFGLDEFRLTKVIKFQKKSYLKFLSMRLSEDRCRGTDFLGYFLGKLEKSE